MDLTWKKAAKFVESESKGIGPILDGNHSTDKL